MVLCRAFLNKLLSAPFLKFGFVRNQIAIGLFQNKFFTLSVEVWNSFFHSFMLHSFMPHVQHVKVCCWHIVYVTLSVFYTYCTHTTVCLLFLTSCSYTVSQFECKIKPACYWKIFKYFMGLMISNESANLYCWPYCCIGTTMWMNASDVDASNIGLILF